MMVEMSSILYTFSLGLCAKYKFFFETALVSLKSIFIKRCPPKSFIKSTISIFFVMPILSSGKHGIFILISRLCLI